MRLQDPTWADHSPGAIPEGTIYRFVDWIRDIAAQARVKQDVFEDFKSYFGPKTYKRSSTAHDSEWDLRWLLDEAGKNAPVFLGTFADACADFKKLGYAVPSVDVINNAVSRSIGYCIERGAVVRCSWNKTEDERRIVVPPEPLKPVVEFLAMKLENPDWAFDSPGIIPRGVLDQTKTLIGQIASRAGSAKDVFETFKTHFAAARGESSTYGSSSTSWAETDMEREMDDAAGNAPLFIAAFVDGCSELREQKVGAPSVDRINQMLAQNDAGYQVAGDTVVATRQRAKPQPRPNPPAATRADGGSSARPKAAEPVKPVKASPLEIFLCHSKGDKPAVLALYARLRDDGYDPWLDVKKLVAGQDWQAEIKAAVKRSHVVVVCLSASSVTKAGFVQKEIRFALDVAEEQPLGRIYIVPARLEECEVPELLARYHWVDLFEDEGYENLLKSLQLRAVDL